MVKGIGLHVVLCYGQESFSQSHIFNGRSVVYLVEDIFGRERAGLFFDAGKDSATSPTIPVSRRHELEP